MSVPVCRGCGSRRIEPGTLGSAAVWLDRQSTVSKVFSGAEVKVVACLDCGTLTLRADPEALRKLVGD